MKIKELLPVLKLNGRTLYNEKEEALFLNWTCSGFSFGLKGKEIKVKVLVYSNQVPGLPNMPTPPADWPCIALTIDEQNKLHFRKELRESGWITLYSSDKVEDHEFRILKPSENARGKLGISEIEVDGDIYKIDKKKIHMEIVGDSITCGFGNEAKDNSFEFKTSEENGWMSYAALAARQLGYDFSMICESGIMAVKAKHPLWDMHAMEDIYEYTDELYDTQFNREKNKWDFETNHNDIVVINLGTNDCNPIKFYRDFKEIEENEKWFEDKFKKFILQVRKANGKDSLICLSLGPMDHYLYHIINKVVNEIKNETNDKKLCSFEYIPINVMFEGYGALGHPSLKTHERMAKELVNYIKKYGEQ